MFIIISNIVLIYMLLNYLIKYFFNRFGIKITKHILFFKVKQIDFFKEFT